MDGMKITLRGIGDGLTRDQNGKELLPKPFVFQCPPMEEFKIQRQFNFGNYDTILEGQFSRFGSRQLMTWQFDTLWMYLAMQQQVTNYALNPLAGEKFQPTRQVAATGETYAGPAYPSGGPLRQRTRGHLHYLPGWVPFPEEAQHTPKWHVQQLAALQDAGAPFSLAVVLNGVEIDGTVLLTKATLTAFDESYKAGEGDAIYLSGVTFQEWRDPRVTRRGSKTRGHHTPATLKLEKNAKGFSVLRNAHGQLIPPKGVPTLAALAKYYYGDPSKWKVIAQANNVISPAPNRPIYQMYPFITDWEQGRGKLKIPKLPTASAQPATGPPSQSGGSGLANAS